MKKQRKRVHSTSNPPNDSVEEGSVKIRHLRFNGFDIYTAETVEGKTLFHKPEGKTMVMAETFRFLGSKENLWLCEDITNGRIHIAPFDRFVELAKTG